VSSELIAAIAGVLGAAVGAGTTLAANWISTRTQLTLADRDREQRSAEVRRAACAGYLVAADSFMDRARELAHKMQDSAPQAECDPAYAPYFACWEQLQRACAPVIIAGPNALSKRAERLQSQLGALGDVCDGWYDAYKNGPAPSRISEFGKARHEVLQARAEFISIAQKHAHPDSAKSAD
jgi:hypothetical protein